MPEEGAKAVYTETEVDALLAALDVTGLSGELADRQKSKAGDSGLGWTLGKLLKGSGAGSNPSEISGWEVVSEVTVSSDVDYVDFTALDINTDKFYALIHSIKNPTVSGSLYSLYRNADYTATNYYSQYISAVNTAISGSRGNNAGFHSVDAGVAGLCFGVICRDLDGYMQFVNLIMRRRASSIALQNRFVSSNNTTTNITSLRISASVSGSIGQNSVLLLCKPRSG